MRASSRGDEGRTGARRERAAAVRRRAVHDQGVLRARRACRNSSGLVARKDIVARRRTPATVARLRAAGAIPLGVTNVSELCMWYEIEQPRLRAQQQPVRLRRASSAAAPAARAQSSAPAARRSGSAATSAARSACRRSSTACSATSRPAGWCPARGQYPVAHGEATRIVATGPLCRRAEDLWPLVKHAGRARRHRRGRHGDDARRSGGGAHRSAHRRRRRGQRAQPGAPRAQGRAGSGSPRRSPRAGARIRRVRFGALRRSFDIWSSTLAPPATGSRSACCSATGGARAARVELLEVGGAPLAAHAAGDRPRHARAHQPPGAGARGAGYVEMGRALRAEILDALGATA